MARSFKFVLFITVLLFQGAVAAQTGSISGTLRDKTSQEVLVGATIRLEGTSLGTSSDINGIFRLQGIPPKTYNLTVQYLGYEPLTRYNVVVTVGNEQTFNLELEPSKSGTQLAEVEVKVRKSVKVASTETPLSIQNLSLEEIKSNPGGNFDISKVVNVLPGVAGTPGGGGFRNDLIIRGGGPSENVYYLDGVEIPVLNHFSTQGAAGGPVGMLNVSFIEDVTLATSAFAAKYDNPLSGVLQFKQRDGNPNRVQGNFRLSSSEAALTTEGPLGKNTTFLASARRSYLQFLFQAIGLPIRPDYWDFQYKITHKINAKTTFTTIGLGAIDDFFFAAPKETTPENLYVLSSAPSIRQWNYTQGFALKHLTENGFWNLTFSRNMFDNRLDQFSDNFNGDQTDEAKRTLGLNSQEIENKLRFDYNVYLGDWKISYGAVAQYVKYNNNTLARIRPEVRDSAGNIIQTAITSAFDTEIAFGKYGFFGQVNRSLFNDRLAISVGARADGNTFTDQGNDIWRTLSPRASASFALADLWKINASVGRYFKIPQYTVLGFRDNTGALVNRDLPYIRADHFVAGLEYLPGKTTRITLEGFYKRYTDYPVSERTGIALANQGADFGIIGNEAVNASGIGRSYGAELFFQQKLRRNFFFTGSYTLFWTEFAGADGKYVASSWDNRHLVSLTGGYKFRRNWELGVKYRYQGGVPYTPLDLEASQRNYVFVGREILDYSRLNQERLGGAGQLDIRIDKKWNFKRTTFNLYIDIVNALASATPSYPTFTLQRNADNTGFATTDGKTLASDASNGIPIVLDDSAGSVIPNIGFIFEF
ncbi:MAG: TonB-dependent receptor [Saprospiraceae bacterium]|nr:TonB-dependent receptor [Saprospiraceae bacterium]